MWSVADKLPRYSMSWMIQISRITYRRGASGSITPVFARSGLRVQTLVVDAQQGLLPEQIANEYDLEVTRVKEAQAFYDAHRAEINASIQAEQGLEAKAWLKQDCTWMRTHPKNPCLTQALPARAGLGE